MEPTYPAKKKVDAVCKTQGERNQLILAASRIAKEKGHGMVGMDDVGEAMIETGIGMIHNKVQVTT